MRVSWRWLTCWIRLTHGAPPCSQVFIRGKSTTQQSAPSEEAVTKPVPDRELSWCTVSLWPCRTILNGSEILRCSLVDMAFCFVCFRDAPQVLAITFPSQVFSGLNALNGLCKSVPKPEAIFMLFLASSWFLLSNHLFPCLSVTFCMLINAFTPLRIQSVLVLFCKMNL